MAHEVNQCETLVNCELKPPMHRENSIQVKTGFQTGQWELYFSMQAAGESQSLLGKWRMREIKLFSKQSKYKPKLLVRTLKH